MTSLAPYRRVDWPIVVGDDGRCQTPRPRSGGVVSVLSAVDELRCYDELDTIYRRSVELLRDKIGLERVALFVFREEDELLHGTWGTGIVGETTDEHEIAFSPGENHKTAFMRATTDRARWLLLEDAPRTFQAQGETKVLERGWIVLTPVVGEGRALGLLVNDGALSGHAVDEAKQTQAAVFCTLLASVIELRRAPDSAQVPPSAFRVRHPLSVARTELVSRAVELIRRDPSLERSTLARALGTNADRIGKLFKAEMGMTVGHYRNRLRLEAFLRLVQHGGDNLLEAALEAGFGSYAQFHRVFRALVGTTPRKYLTGHSG